MTRSIYCQIVSYEGHVTGVADVGSISCSTQVYNQSVYGPVSTYSTIRLSVCVDRSLSMVDGRTL